MKVIENVLMILAFVWAADIIAFSIFVIVSFFGTKTERVEGGQS